MTPIGEFIYSRRVQYKDTDASGIAHFSCFFVYAEEAEHAMWRAAGQSVEPRESTLGWPRVSASFDFFRPLRFEDEIEVRIRVIERTTKSFRYQSVIVSRGEVVAIGTSTSVCVRKVPGEPMRASEIPAAVAESFTVLPPVKRPRTSRVAGRDGGAVNEGVRRVQDDGLSG